MTVERFFRVRVEETPIWARQEGEVRVPRDDAAARDIISTGTASGVGPLQPGDVVEIEVEGVGTLGNPVVEG